MALSCSIGWSQTNARTGQPADITPVSQPSTNGTFIAIDHPRGARGTRAWGVNPQGDVVGSYDDIHKVRHGFLWHGGRFTTLDAPEAGHGRPGPLGPQGTTLYDINASGDITGRYIDSDHVAHAFLLRRPVFYTLDDPMAGSGRGRGTQADGINEHGDMVGDYIDDSFNLHGFVWRDGVFTTIDAPHAPTGRYQGTHAFGINTQGDIVLFTEPGATFAHSFLLNDGRFTPRDDPHGVFGTFLNGISSKGVIVGLWVDGNNVAHGLTLCRGVFTTVDDPRAGAASGQGTTLNKINPRGESAGWYTDHDNVDHGFLFIPDNRRDGSCAANRSGEP
jgi:uncharacterized membrane protein